MPKLLTSLSVAAVLMASTAFAQTTTNTDAAADTATEAAGAATQAADTATDAPKDTGQAAGTDTNAAPEATSDQAGANTATDTTEQPAEDPTYVKETHGDWEIKCFRNEGGDDPCQMFQLLKEDNGNPIAEFSLFRLPKDGKAVAGATIVVPLGTLLTEDLKLSIDGGRSKNFPFSFCSMVGCYSRIGLTAEDVAALKNGSTGMLQIVPAQAPDQKVDIKVSLSGFTAAFENASELKK